MNELVILKNNDVFTDSLVIAKGTDNEHKSVVSLLKKYKAKFEKFGDFRFSDLKSTNPKGGRPTRIYFLNEPQATLLITFLDNTDIVVDFKVELVRQFYQMRQLLLEKQTQLWQDTRTESKINRLMETDEIKQLVEYAKEQGSKNADKYYIIFSKLANKAVGINSGQRELIKLHFVYSFLFSVKYFIKEETAFTCSSLRVSIDSNTCFLVSEIP